MALVVLPVISTEPCNRILPKLCPFSFLAQSLLFREYERNGEFIVLRVFEWYYTDSDHRYGDPG